MTDDPTVPQTVDLPYDPDKAVNEWGWLWMDDEWDGVEWALVRTYEDEEGVLRVEGWNIDDPHSDTTTAYQAEAFRGLPYIALSRPACAPGAGLLVTVHLPRGAAIAHSWGKPCPEADRARDQVLAALNPFRGREAADLEGEPR